jgi:hypothetical protein
MTDAGTPRPGRSNGVGLGKLLYGPNGSDFEVDDRTLAHLQIVMIAKLRRSESFSFTWIPPREYGEGRSVIWISSPQYLSFRFSGGRQPTINRRWIEELMAAANSVAGLHIVPEPDQEAGADSAIER